MREEEKLGKKPYTYLAHLPPNYNSHTNFGAFVIRFSLCCCCFLFRFVFMRAYLIKLAVTHSGVCVCMCVCVHCVYSTFMYHIMVHVVCGVATVQRFVFRHSNYKTDSSHSPFVLFNLKTPRKWTKF